MKKRQNIYLRVHLINQKYFIVQLPMLGPGLGTRDIRGNRISIIPVILTTITYWEIIIKFANVNFLNYDKYIRKETGSNSIKELQHNNSVSLYEIT